jgi:hypothetical protein
MSFIPYNLGLPNPPDDPADDVGAMQVNCNSIATWTGVDHVALGSSPAGWHKDIHFVATVGTPANIVGIGQLYTNIIASDTRLFFESGNGIITALTGPNSPSLNPSGFGYVWLPGPLLVQWGFVNTGIPTSYRQLTYLTNGNIPFPTNCFGVFTQIYSSDTVPSGNGNITIRSDSVALTGFQWAGIGSSSQYIGFYYLAIGN